MASQPILRHMSAILQQWAEIDGPPGYMSEIRGPG
jgi:hypothetical protein